MQLHNFSPLALGSVIEVVETVFKKYWIQIIQTDKTMYNQGKNTCTFLCMSERKCGVVKDFISLIDIQKPCPCKPSLTALLKQWRYSSHPCGQCCSGCAFVCQTVVPCRRWGIASHCKINDPATGKSNELEAPNVLSLQSNRSFFISVRPKHQLCTEWESRR